MKKNSLRVAMIAPPWLTIPPSGYGGIENVIYALVPELIKLGVHVELFATGDSKVRASKKHSLYPAGQYEHIHKPQYDSLPITIAHILNALDYIARDGHFDVIHDHNGFIGPLVFMYTNKKLPPAVHTLHGPPFTTPDRLQVGKPDNLPMWRELAKADGLYVVGISKALMRSAPRALKAITLPPVHNAMSLRGVPFVVKKSNYFMTLGRFHPDKGQDIAVRVCTELGVKLKMAGTVGDIGNTRQLLLELANPLSKYRSVEDFRYYSDYIFPNLIDNQITYIGEVEGKRKINLLSKARALLFPIQWDEPFGMVAIEALATGTPVVAMARGALPEIIQHGVNGFLAKNETEFKKYVAIVDQIDPAACRKSVEENFSAPIMAARYIERYVEAMQRSKH